MPSQGTVGRPRLQHDFEPRTSAIPTSCTQTAHSSTTAWGPLPSGRALTYDSSAAATHLYLAETYLAMDRREEAAAELQRVLDAPIHPDWVPEIGEFKHRAATLLATMPRR